MFPHANASHQLRLFQGAVDAYQDDPRGTRVALTNPHCPRKVLDAAGEKFLTMPDQVQLLIAIAWHRNTSPALLVKLAAHENRHVRYAIACNVASPVAALSKLVGDTELVVRFHLAEHRNANGRLLTRLLKDEDKQVVEAALRNKRTPLAARLKTLGDCQNLEYLRAAAANPDTPPHLLKHWATLDPSNVMRRTLALNPSTPAVVLEPFALQLVPDSERLDALQNAVAQNPNLPSDIAALLTSPVYSAFTRGALAQNTCISDTVKELLVVDPNPTVRQRVATHHVISSQVLSQIVDEEIEPNVMAAYVKHQSNIPVDSVTRFLRGTEVITNSLRVAVMNRDWSDADLAMFTEELFARLLSGSKPDVRAGLMASRLPSRSTLENAVSSRKVYDRVGAALNPRSSVSSLEKLSHDVDPLVAQIAATHPKLARRVGRSKVKA